MITQNIRRNTFKSGIKLCSMMSESQNGCMASLTFNNTEKRINSFVFLDLETTDLIRGKTMPRITELAMIAIARDHLQVPQAKLPRVLSKLVIPINPNIEISEIVEKLTHLSNQILKKVNCFDPDVYCSVMHFIQRLEQPICFVAHNGKRFDFPVLLKEFRDLNQEVPSDILSIDSLEVFRHFFNEEGLKKAKNGMLEQYNSFYEDSCDDIFCAAALETIETSLSFDEGVELDRTQSFDKQNNINSDMQRVNEKTPESQIIKQEKNKQTMSHKNNKLQFYEKPANLKLGIIFQHMTGSSAENEHNAESDCLTLLRCANLIGEDFIQFADEHAKPLVSYERKNDS